MSRPRVRFAPSPTGFMHLGNVRAALLNFLFAKATDGIFILRLEDTDTERNFDPNGQQLIADLHWLGLTYQEGPDKGGPHAPYAQSERSAIYQKYLDVLKQKHAIYRCFCTAQELEKKRERSLQLKKAPRYDRACLKLTQQEIDELLAKGTLYIWRLKLPEHTTIEVADMAHGTIQFNLEHFSDFPLTRSDGSFTFLFANCVDDIEMQITHVLRGEDHLSNTANQLVLYQLLEAKSPLFWHLPIICNASGKKLSKRDFGFSLNDLKSNGYLPEAIVNYLAILGGSYEQEVMSIEELAKALQIKATGPIKYDTDKLVWFNHAWLQKIPLATVIELCTPHLTATYPQAATLSAEALHTLIKKIRPEIKVITDCIPLAHFYFNTPSLTKESLLEHIPAEQLPSLLSCISQALNVSSTAQEFLQAAKTQIKAANIEPKLLFTVLRLMLTGSTHGLSLNDILELLGHTETVRRIQKWL
jgi:nondiscriminating glutamyl-tRNA synthetase